MDLFKPMLSEGQLYNVRPQLKKKKKRLASDRISFEFKFLYFTSVFTLDKILFEP